MHVATRKALTEWWRTLFHWIKRAGWTCPLLDYIDLLRRRVLYEDIGKYFDFKAGIHEIFSLLNDSLKLKKSYLENLDKPGGYFVDHLTSLTKTLLSRRNSI